MPMDICVALSLSLSPLAQLVIERMTELLLLRLDDEKKVFLLRGEILGNARWRTLRLIIQEPCLYFAATFGRQQSFPLFHHLGMN